jgi:hypothetical protein
VDVVASDAVEADALDDLVAVAANEVADKFKFVAVAATAEVGLDVPAGVCDAVAARMSVSVDSSLVDPSVAKTSSCPDAVAARAGSCSASAPYVAAGTGTGHNRWTLSFEDCKSREIQPGIFSNARRPHKASYDCGNPANPAKYRTFIPREREDIAFIAAPRVPSALAILDHAHDQRPWWAAENSEQRVAPSERDARMNK